MVNSLVKELSSKLPYCNGKNKINKKKNPQNQNQGFATLRWKRTALLTSLNLSVNYMDLHPTKG